MNEDMGPVEPIYRRSEAIGELAAKIALSQHQMGKLIKNKKNPEKGNSYSDLAAVLEAIEPFHANGIAVLQFVTSSGHGLVTVVTMLVHGEQWIESTLQLVSMKILKGGDNVAWLDPQGTGSGITYGRRYALMAICALAAEDDDGQRASRQFSDSRTQARAAEYDRRQIEPPARRPAPSASPETATAAQVAANAAMARIQAADKDHRREAAWKELAEAADRITKEEGMAIFNSAGIATIEDLQLHTSRSLGDILVKLYEGRRDNRFYREPPPPPVPDPAPQEPPAPFTATDDDLPSNLQPPQSVELTDENLLSVLGDVKRLLDDNNMPPPKRVTALVDSFVQIKRIWGKYFTDAQWEDAKKKHVQKTTDLYKREQGLAFAKDVLLQIQKAAGIK